jgi:hypothetical protein
MPQLTELQGKIESFRTLPTGWDYGRGVPASKRAARNAKIVATILDQSGAEDLEALPGEDGGVMIIGYSGDASVEIQCFSNGTFDYLYSTDDAPGDVEVNLAFGDIVNKLGSLGWLSLRLFVSCTRNVMSRGSDDSIESLFGTRPVAEFRSFAANASKRAIPTSANISGNITARPSVVSPLSSGEYRRINLPMVAA